MSSTNGLPAEITLDELARLVRLLGMLGSSSDSEVLAAGKFAAKWVREHQTDWQTLLTPEPEPAVSAVVAVADPEALEAAQTRDRLEAYESGYQDGMKTGIAKAMAQVKAQARYAPPTSQWAHSFTTMAQNAPGSPLGAPAPAPGFGPGPAPQGPVRPPSGPGGGPPGAPSGALWSPGTWQRVCQDLLDQHAAVPGVLRSREEIFVADILRRGFSALTPAQEHWLRDIAGRNHMSW